MKKFLSLLLVITMVASLLCITTASAESDTLVIETRTGTHTYHVGDRFTFTYWLDIEPELVNYVYDLAISEDSESIKQVLNDSMEIEDSEYLTIDTLNGYIGYDPNFITLISYEMPEKKNFPELTNTRFLQINDPLAQSLLGGSVLDFFKDGLAFFYPDPIGFAQRQPTSAFQSCRQFVKLSFVVSAGSDEPMYMRAKIRDLDVTTDSGYKAKLIDDGQANFCDVVTYETFDDEEPSIFPSTIVDEVAFDVRFLDPHGNDVVNLRPGPGASVSMYGVTYDGRYVRFTKTISGKEIVNSLTGAYGEKIVKFYDIPYGQYYVDCTYIDEDGGYFATPDPEKGEHVNVPMTGSTQALWLIGADTSQYMRIFINVEWIGDGGCIAQRPQYLLASLVNGGSILKERPITNTTEQEQIDCVSIYDANDEKIDYALEVTPISEDGVCPYIIDVEKTSDNEFTIKCTYLGDESTLDYPDADGHYWEYYKKFPSLEPTCTESGYYYERCADCRCYRKVTVDPIGHEYVEGQTDPTCEDKGFIGFVCSHCGAVDETRPYETIPALGHDFSTEWTVDVEPTCTVGGYKSHHCARCEATKNSTYIGPLGHDFQLINHKDPGCRTEGYTGDIACTRCDLVQTKGEVIPATGHHTELRDDKEPTCTLSGYTGDQVCVDCGMVVSHGSVIPPTGHDYSKVINSCDATCTEDGYTGDVVCANCGKFDHKGETIPAIGHNYVITSEKQNTESEAGYIIYTCTHCGDVKTKTLYPGCPSTIFYDVDTNKWYHEAIDFVLKYDIMHGVSEHSFEPDSPLTRAMLVTILYNYSGEPKINEGNPFADVSEDAWYYIPITWAYENGIVSGYEDGTFRPDKNINREELVTVMYNYYTEYLGRDGQRGSIVLSKFTDAKDISNWAYKPFRWAVGNGIISGTSADTLSPREVATRAQTANVIMLLDGLIRKE